MHQRSGNLQMNISQETTPTSPASSVRKTKPKKLALQNDRPLPILDPDQQPILPLRRLQMSQIPQTCLSSTKKYATSNDSRIQSLENSSVSKPITKVYGRKQLKPVLDTINKRPQSTRCSNFSP